MSRIERIDRALAAMEEQVKKPKHEVMLVFCHYCGVTTIHEILRKTKEGIKHIRCKKCGKHLLED